MDAIEYNLQGISIAILFGLLQGILMLTVFSSKKRYRQHSYIIILLVSLIIVQWHSFLVRSGMMVDFLFFLNTDVPMALLFGPLMFFYTINLLGGRISFKQKLLHCLPFIFYFIYSFNFFLQSQSYKKNVLAELMGLEIPFPELTTTFLADPWNIQGWVVVEFMSIHLTVYVIASLIYISKQKIKVKTKDFRIKTQWLQFLNGLFLLSAFTLFLSEGGIVNGYVFLSSPLPKFSPDLYATFAMYVTTLYLFINTDLISFKSKKYNKSVLPKEFMKQKTKSLIKVIENEKLFLDPGFSLDMLSQKTGLSRHHISQIINQELNLTFASLTNRYRIKEAKKLLNGDTFIKMEQLAFQLGYRSKSSFFNAFKKATALTPSQFKNLK